MTGIEAPRRLLQANIDAHLFPGCVAAWGGATVPATLLALGRQGYDEVSTPVDQETLYDLASLTKIIATTPLTMQIVEAGALDLQTRVAEVWPDFTGAGRESVTVGHLLDHSSGLPAHLPLFRDLVGPAAFLERLLSLPLEAPPGERCAYSDLGFILLGALVEQVTCVPLEQLVRERVLEPLGMHATGFNPGPELRARCAPTEFDPWRGRLLQGEVHDENAWALGGVAAHAGLFGSALDVTRLARCLLGGGQLEGQRLCRASTLARFTSRTRRPPGSSRALGFDTPSLVDSSAGGRLSRRAFGHLGFTGTSLWIDPEHDLYVLLLSNSVHPRRSGDPSRLRRARAELADATAGQWLSGE